LRINEKPLLRAYSNASPNYEDQLEFLSTKVGGGPLTSRLQHIQVGDAVIVGRKPTGTLVLNYPLSTATGLAPFMSIVRDPEIYEKFKQVILVHGVRTVEESAYHDLIRRLLKNAFAQAPAAP